MNTEVMFSSKTDLWETPQYFFDALDNDLLRGVSGRLHGGAVWTGLTG